MITVPNTFRAMPRWWHDVRGRRWLDELPALVDAQCARWSVAPDGPVRHGSNALVVPVRGVGTDTGGTPGADGADGDQQAALRLSPPGDPVEEMARALGVWDGRGTVRLLQVDAPRRALLLERLDADHPLSTEPLHDAVAVLAELTRTLAVPVPRDVPSTSAVAADIALDLERHWRAQGEPIPRRQLDVALAHASDLAAHRPEDSAVDADLHFDQALRNARGDWVLVDPVMLRGDPEHDLARVLWSRLDELPDEPAVVDAFRVFVDVAGVPPDRAHAWVVVRSASYLLWGLEHGLTEDPARCRRLLDVFTRPGAW